VIEEEGGRIRFQVVVDELFGEEEVAGIVAPEHLQPVPPLRRHPWVEVGFDLLAVEVLLVVEVHKWRRKLKVGRLRVVIRERVVPDVRVMEGSG
jgi:hypothetical protein